MSAQPTLISTVRDLPLQIVNADGTANKSLGVAAPAAGSRIKSIIISSTDTAPRVLQLMKSIGGVDYVLGEIDVAAGAGTDGVTSSVNGLAVGRIPGTQYDGISRWLDVATGTVINFKVKTAVTAAKAIQIVAEVGDFT